VAAGLLLVPAAGVGRALDGLRVADAGFGRLDADPETRLEPLDRDPQVHLALAVQAHFADLGS
jgi:hypothetical protein